MSRSACSKIASWRITSCRIASCRIASSRASSLQTASHASPPGRSSSCRIFSRPISSCRIASFRVLLSELPPSGSPPDEAPPGGLPLAWPSRDGALPRAPPAGGPLPVGSLPVVRISSCRIASSCSRRAASRAASSCLITSSRIASRRRASARLSSWSRTASSPRRIGPGCLLARRLLLAFRFQAQGLLSPSLRPGGLLASRRLALLLLCGTSSWWKASCCAERRARLAAAVSDGSTGTQMTQGGRISRSEGSPALGAVPSTSTTCVHAGRTSSKEMPSSNGSKGRIIDRHLGSAGATWKARRPVARMQQAAIIPGVLTMNGTAHPSRDNDRYGTHGRVLHVDLSTSAHRVETVDESVYRQFLGGYGLGAWLMWKHFPAGDRRARARGVLRHRLGPADRREDAVLGPHPDRRQVADDRTAGPTATRAAASRASCAPPASTGCVVRGRAAQPSVLVVRDGEVSHRARGRALGQGGARDLRRPAPALRRQASRSACRRIGPAGEGRRASRR